MRKFFIAAGVVYLLVWLWLLTVLYKEYPDFFIEAPAEFTWMTAIGTLAVMGVIFRRWLSPGGKPRKTLAERTRNDRALLFEKNEELQMVGVFDRFLGEFAVLLVVCILHAENVITGYTGWGLCAVMSGAVWLVTRPPRDLRHAPDRIYGTKDALLITRRGVTESIPHSHIARFEALGRNGLVWYGYTIVLHLTGPGKSGEQIRFFMTTPSRALQGTENEDEFPEPVPFEEDFNECVRLLNRRAARDHPAREKA